MSDQWLTEGWKYSVATDEDQRSDGVFKGYAMLGTESAIVIQMQNDGIRIIPVASIIHIDLLESGDHKQDGKKPESVYYG